MDPFGDDDWPDEPDSFDPESLGPATPDVEPDIDDLLDDPEALDDDLMRAFWGAVICLNIAIAAGALGVFLIYFRGQWTPGSIAVGIGVGAGLGTIHYYRTYPTRDETATSERAPPDTSTETETVTETDTIQGQERNES